MTYTALMHSVIEYACSFGTLQDKEKRKNKTMQQALLQETPRETPGLWLVISNT